MSSEWEKKTKVNKEGRTVNWKERETKNAETGETKVEKEYRVVFLKSLVSENIFRSF